MVHWLFWLTSYGVGSVFFSDPQHFYSWTCASNSTRTWSGPCIFLSTPKNSENRAQYFAHGRKLCAPFPEVFRGLSQSSSSAALRSRPRLVGNSRWRRFFENSSRRSCESSTSRCSRTKPVLVLRHQHVRRFLWPLEPISSSAARLESSTETR
jgi:hypothetical protein